jgi:transposase-like protein
MGYMKKYKCPIFFSTQSVIRKTKRNKSLLFFCKSCKKYFSVNTISDCRGKLSFLNGKTGVETIKKEGIDILSLF